MKTKLLLLTIILPISLFSQNITISGYISDAETGEKIISAIIHHENSKNNVLSNNFGFYSLQIKKEDSLKITVFCVGYKTQNIIIPTKNINNINFKLISNNKIEEVIVSANIPINKRIETSVLEIPVNQLNKIPAVGSEPDIMKAFQLMPGVQSGNEGNSGLFVRGGGSDENLILLDDVPLYYVNHLGGFVSVFNSDAIKKVSLIKGGFPARYGGRLSSIMDVRMKEGNDKEYHGNISLGIITSKFSLEGPIKKDESSFLISGRALVWGLLVQPLTSLVSNASVGYNFYDLNAKFNHKINDKNNLFFSFYKGDDNVIVKYKDKDFSGNNVVANNILRWGNTLFAGRWNHVFNPRLFSNLTLSYTKYRYDSSVDYNDKTENQEYSLNFITAINDIILKSDFEYNISSKYKIRFGSNSVYHHFQPGFSYYKLNSPDISEIDTTYGYSDIYAPETTLYLENEFRLGKIFSGNIGIHASYYYIENTAFFSPEPRILLNFLTSKSSSIKLSYTQMQQKVHLLTRNTASSPMDVWIPSTSNLPPSNSKQYAVSFNKSIAKNNAELSIEAYYKTSDNLIAYKEGATYRTISNSWIDKLETQGKGTSYGIELLLQKKQGKLTGWIGYTYAKTDRQFTNLNFGNPYPFKYDRRHDISIVAMYNINSKIDISANWVYGSGYAYTLPIGKYEAVSNGNTNIHYFNSGDIWYDEIILTYADRNKSRMRAYHRMDLAVNMRKQKKHGIRTLTFSIYNVYNRQNPYYYYTKVKDSEVKLFQQSLFPIVPSISYSLKF